MTARKAVCRFCTRRIALTPKGRVWPHGPAGGRCRKPGRLPATLDARTYWPTRHYGRHVTTIPGPDTWNPKENAA